MLRNACKSIIGLRSPWIWGVRGKRDEIFSDGSDEELDFDKLTEEQKALANLFVGDKFDPYNKEQQEEYMYNGPVYELLRIRVKPNHITKFLELIPELESRKEGEGKLMGSFMVEVGGLNEFIHLWAWRDVKERQLDLESAVKEPGYAELESECMKCIMDQKRSLLSVEEQLNTSFVGEDKKEPTEQGIYELETTGTTDSEKLRSIKKSAGGFLVGKWMPLVDDPSEDVFYNLWRFDNIFQYDIYINQITKLSKEDPEETLLFPPTELLSPCLYSPLQ